MAFNPRTLRCSARPSSATRDRRTISAKGRCVLNMKLLRHQVRQHAEETRHRQQQREPAKHQRHPERDPAARTISSLAHGPHGHDHAHVRIDPGEMVEERLPGQVRIAVDARDDRSIRRVERWSAGTCRASLTSVKRKPGHVPGDADHRDDARRQRRFVARPTSRSVEIRLEPERFADAIADSARAARAIDSDTMTTGWSSSLGRGERVGRARSECPARRNSRPRRICRPPMSCSAPAVGERRRARSIKQGRPDGRVCRDRSIRLRSPGAWRLALAH